MPHRYLESNQRLPERVTECSIHILVVRANIEAEATRRTEQQIFRFDISGIFAGFTLLNGMFTEYPFQFHVIFEGEINGFFALQ